MKLSTAPEKAREAPTDLSAARLYNSIEHELELGNYEEDDADAGEDALAILEERFPGVRARARQVSTPPALSRRASSSLGSRPRAEGEPAGTPAPRRPSPGAGRRSGSSSRRRSVGSVAGAAAGDATDTVLMAVRWLLIAGAVYQVFQPKGSAAFSGVLNGIMGGISRVVEPVDPLASSATVKGASKLGPIGGGDFSPPAAAPVVFNQGPGRLAGRPATGPIGAHITVPTSPLALPIGGP